ncbi:MAG: sigma-54 dependent transcriptional regulator [Syntrophales bacterium]
MFRHKILIVDDDRLLQNSLRNILTENYEVTIAGSGEEAAGIMARSRVDLVLLDIRLPGMDGMETLETLRGISRETVVIMMTAYEDIKSVVTSMKRGAFDYLVKPLDIDELEVIIEKALETLRLRKELEELRGQYLREFDFDNIIGESAGIRNALMLAAKIAQSPDTTVLIEGETGTGKEVIAKAIHYRSARFGMPLVEINCGAISRDLVESELFGYDAGTFTGALHAGKKGKFEIAEGGTLLLDEVGELLPSSQVKLLRFLEEKAFYPVGGAEKKQVDVRVIAATNKSLEEAMQAGTFRSDLYYRLNVARIWLPPLRERREDIVPLALHFMDCFNKKFGKNFEGISSEAGEKFLQYHWPGNVRELRNILERIVLTEKGPSLERGHLSLAGFPLEKASKPYNLNISLPLSGGLEELNRELICKALVEAGGNRSRAAKLLGISRPTLVYRIEKYGINTDRS